MKTFDCSHCGKTFTRNGGHANRTNVRTWKAFCSRECYSNARKMQLAGQTVVRVRRPTGDRVVDREIAIARRNGDPAWCKSCPTPAMEGGRYCAACKERRGKWWAKRKAEKVRDGICLSCRKPAKEGGRYCLSHMQKKNECTQRNNRRIKEEVFRAYGGVICACCGETTIEFLTIDHVNNDGAQHRRELFGKSKQIGGSRLYRVLKKQGFPPGFQVLCFNCNIAKGFYGECPHQKQSLRPFTFVA